LGATALASEIRARRSQAMPPGAVRVTIFTRVHERTTGNVTRTARGCRGRGCDSLALGDDRRRRAAQRARPGDTLPLGSRRTGARDRNTDSRCRNPAGSPLADAAADTAGPTGRRVRVEARARGLLAELRQPRRRVAPGGGAQG